MFFYLHRYLIIRIQFKYCTSSVSNYFMLDIFNFSQEHSEILTQAFVVIETTGGHEIGLLEYLVTNQIVVHGRYTRIIKNCIRAFHYLSQIRKRVKKNFVKSLEK